MKALVGINAGGFHFSKAFEKFCLTPTALGGRIFF
jgi:hypothetical protein